MRSALRPLRLRGFPQLASANLVNELGNWLGEIALAVLVYEQTGSPLATAALFLGTQFAPALLAPPLVVRLEHLHARRALPLLYLGEAAAFAALASMADGFALAAVLAIAILDGSMASAARALTRSTAAALLTPSGMLREGNAVLNMGFTAGAALGPAIAGVVVATAGAEAALYADAVSFLAVAVLLLGARGLPRVEVEAATLVARLRAGFRYVRERPVLRRLLGAQAAAFVFFAVVIPIEVVFAKDTLGAGDAGYGALLASWGAGMVAGSFAFAALGRISLPVLLGASTLAIGIAYLATGLAPTLLVACAASVVGGVGNGIQWVALVTAVQEATAGPYQARVVAMLESIASAMPGIGFVLGGGVAALLDPRAAYAVAGAGVIVVLVAAVAILREADWSSPAPDDEGAAAAGALSPAPLADPHRPADTAADAVS